MLHAHGPQRQTNLLQSVGRRSSLGSSLQQRLDPFRICFGSMLSLGPVQCSLSQDFPFIYVKNEDFQMLRQVLGLTSRG